MKQDISDYFNVDPEIIGEMTVDEVKVLIKVMENSKSKGEFTLGFDEPPALVFVQEKAGTRCEVYQDGVRLKGVRNVKISSGYDEPTTHEIEYLTGVTKK